MTQRCADQDDQEHVILRLSAGGQRLLGWRPHPDAPCRQGAAVMLYVLLPPEGRGALHAGSFTRLRRFTIEQPSRLFLSLAGFRACLVAGRR